MAKPLEKDKEIFEVLNLETKRQQNHLELIASENYVSPAVLQAAGSVLTNKYAEKDIMEDANLSIWQRILQGTD